MIQRRFCYAWAVVCALALAGTTAARAQDAKDATPVLDKAIKALGGEEKLGKVLMGATWKAKGTITFGENDSPFTSQYTAQGLDRIRAEFVGDFGGMQFKGVTVLAGDKGWRDFGGMRMELDKEGLANEKRTAYLNLIPVAILPLKGKEFKAEAIGEETIGGKPAAGVKATGPDGKEFKLHFDKESGLPVRLVAKVIGFMGEEYTQETTYGEYQEMAGIKKATKVVAKRDGEKFIENQVTEFKILDTVDAKLFTEPQ